MADQATYDLIVVGGGINGCGIARDAAGRGLKVLLVEQGDLAEYTSSASTKLIHGGLRYLEYYEFRLVSEALQERERLLRLAPHIIWPLRFVLPQDEGVRPAWMIRAGLFLYDHLGGRQSLPATEGVDLRTSPVGAPLQPRLARAFMYSDGWVDDARLVVLNAMDAAARGADVRTRVKLVDARREQGLWTATLQSAADGVRQTVSGRILVNAAGPWVSELLTSVLHSNDHAHLRLIKGSHIVVRRIYEGEHAFMFQNADKRIVFAIPYEQDFTLIGTTDVPHEGHPGKVTISDEETRYLCDSVSRYFAKPVVPADVVWSYAGVRPLYDNAVSNASAVTRDYVLKVEGERGQAPILSIFGGKITTFRRLAEHALEKLEPYLPGLAPAWTASTALPGGDLPGASFEAFLSDLIARKPFLPRQTARRLARAYGTRVDILLGAASSLPELGRDFGGGLSQAEVDYLVANEWAVTADDILWRRSKLGLHVPAAAAASLAEELARKPGAR